MAFDASVITLKGVAPPDLKRAMATVFPDVPLKVTRAIDLRKVPVSLLHESRLVTYGSKRALERGRQFHHELGTPGAVGLAQSVRLALKEDVERPLLLFEEDCKIVNIEQFREDVQSLMAHTRDFDVAVLGMWSKTDKTPVDFLPSHWVRVTGPFMWLHCVLYSPTGRRKVARYLEEPLDMQIDALYGALARSGELRVVGKLYKSAVQQSAHHSTVQKNDHLHLRIPCAYAIMTLVLLFFLCARIRR